MFFACSGLWLLFYFSDSVAGSGHCGLWLSCGLVVFSPLFFSSFHDMIVDFECCKGFGWAGFVYREGEGAKCLPPCSSTSHDSFLGEPLLGMNQDIYGPCDNEIMKIGPWHLLFLTCFFSSVRRVGFVSGFFLFCFSLVLPCLNLAFPLGQLCFDLAFPS